MANIDPKLYRTYQPGRCVMGRIPQGADPLLAMSELAEKENIKMAQISVLGAVSRACIAYYDQNGKQYHNLEYDRPLEISFCFGNLSQKGGKPFIHFHILLGDHDGATWSGHLVEGSKVFAAEFTMIELIGPTLSRDAVDSSTGLALWEFNF